jgi:hypothetical protein
MIDMIMDGQQNGRPFNVVDSCENNPGANLHQLMAANIGAALGKSKLVDSCKNNPGANLHQSTTAKMTSVQIYTSRWLQT